MKYYYYDMVMSDEPLYEYKSFEEFKKGLLWNRDVAAEYGDRVQTRKRLEYLIDKGEEFAIELNGATFIMCEDINTFCDGFYKD